jgi:hypothetical protein
LLIAQSFIAVATTAATSASIAVPSRMVFFSFL